MTTTRLDDPAPHGSLGVGHLRPILAEPGFGLVLGPHARQRLLQRRYEKAGTA